MRALATPSDSLILSASRDATAISWTRSSPHSPFKQSAVLRPGPRYVNALTYIPPSPDAPEGEYPDLSSGQKWAESLRREQGYAVTGGQDAIINIFSLSSKREDSNFQLIGHTNNVCALHALPDGTIISGSWDQYVLGPQLPSSLPCILTMQHQDCTSLEEIPAGIRADRTCTVCLGSRRN